MHCSFRSFYWFTSTALWLLCVVWSYAPDATAGLVRDESLAELRDVQQRVQAGLDRSIAATVAVQSPFGVGSGVVVNADGLILTAAHVFSKPGKEVDVIFSDGSTVKATTLGLHEQSDAGLIQIEQSADQEWPFVEMDSGPLDEGDWCFALGHPGGVDEQRGIVLRVGRVLENRRYKVKSDCELLSGDSGGPLFNLAGKVIGIHSFIGGEFSDNYHVSMEPFRSHWAAMLDRKLITRSGHGQGGFLGVGSSSHPDGVIIRKVLEGTAARRAGIQVGDIVTTVDGQPVREYGTFNDILKQKAPGEKVDFTVLRQEETVKLTVQLGERK
jgi:serine protease Do